MLGQLKTLRAVGMERMYFACEKDVTLLGGGVQGQKAKTNVNE